MNWLLWHGALESAGRVPEAVAVRTPEASLTYGDLVDQSGSVAASLHDLGLRRGDRVGLWAPRSARSVAVMLGTSRAGGAYVPVDPSAPAVRGSLILADAGVRVLATTSRLLPTLGPIPSLEAVILLDDGAAEGEGGLPRVLPWSQVMAHAGGVPDPRSVETDPAYMLYTSGSTGTPKGVVITHRNALTFIHWAVEAFGVTAGDRLSNHAPFHFDLSVFDLYAAQTAGASVSLVPERLAPFPAELAKWIHREAITVWYSVPSALTRLLQQGELGRFDYSHVHTVLFAGEVFPVKHLRPVMDHFPAATFHNLYGPTETNVCTWYTVPRPLPPGDADLPIGAPCANTDAFAVDDEGRRVEAGGEGELLVRGPGVMVGYWGLPERTARSLVQNPLHDRFSDPTYRTGDLVRVLSDGSFGFLGRRDHMVKTRGYRVELGEVEHALNQCPGVQAAAAVALPDEEMGARIVAAFARVEGQALEPDDVLAFCLTRLPRYAVPASLTLVDALPLTSTGKVDRQTLGALLARVPENQT
jgi:amino acid adenylation domain-containing protein